MLARSSDTEDEPMKTLRNIMTAVLLAILIAVPAIAQGSTPPSTKMQGYLSDKTGGTPVPAEGTYTMTFDLYNDEFAGSLIDSSGALSVVVSAGLYDVDLPFTEVDFGGTVRYIEINVDGEILSPRVKVSSAPFAFIAEKLDGMDSTDFSEAVHEHVGEEITSGTVGEGVIDSAIARDSEIMPAVLADDGPGSGLDADTLDGIEGTSYLTGTSGWSLTGNTGTTSGTHYLGTTDSRNLEFRVEGMRVLQISTPHWAPNVLGGASGNLVSTSAGHLAQTIAGGGEPGNPNQTTGGASTICGGVGNTAAGGAAVGGGKWNSANASWTTIGGGHGNQAGFQPGDFGQYNVIGGGLNNSALGGIDVIGGGQDNSTTGGLSVIGGGLNNEATGARSTVSGGEGNSAGLRGTIGGGWNNGATGGISVIAGGRDNTTASDYGVIGGGRSNTTNGHAHQTIGGGFQNNASNAGATIGGGEDNSAGAFFPR